MIKKIVLSLMAMLGICTLAFAQNKQVTGMVTNEMGEPIIGALVQIEGTVQGASADVDGNFSLTVPENGTLVISFSGYDTQYIPVAGKSHIEVVLAENSIDAGTAIVVGYGTGKKITSVIGSVDQVKAAKLENRPSNNMADALQGQVAGMQVMTANGELNTTSAIRIQGLGSITASSEPLILLDGSPISASTMLQLNQNDIASINILKDASATSIYGSRASNGVIYVMTKTGRRDRGENVEVTLRTQYSMTSAVEPHLKPMNTTQILDFMGHFGAYNAGADVTQGDAYETVFAQQRSQWVSRVGLSDEQQKISTNFWDEYLKKNAPMYQIDLSVNGGSAKTSYYISGGYMDSTGILPGSWTHRYNFRSNLDIRANDWLSAGLNVGIAYSNSSQADTAATTGALYTNNPVLAAFITPPYQSLYNEDGSMKDYLDYGAQNPLTFQKYSPSTMNRLSIDGAAFVQLQPVKGLTIRSTLSVNALDWRSSAYNSRDFPEGVGLTSGSGRGSELFQRQYGWTWSNTAEYKHTFNNLHHFTALLGHETLYNYNNYFSVAVMGITSRFLNLQMGAETDGMPSYLLERWASNSVFGRLEYDYNDRYFVDITLRNDASSRFAKAHRNALFWSAGAMWNVKGENFLRDNEIISALRLRASYGTQGNSSFGNYSHLRYLVPSLNGAESYGYEGILGWSLGSMGNPDLTWESQSKLNVGFDIQLLNKLDVEFSYYYRQSDDLLMNIPMAPSTGYTSRSGNTGTMVNSGVEVKINYNIYQTEDWFVNFTTTFGYNKNKITKLWQDDLKFQDYGPMQAWSVGDPYGVWYLQEFRGVDPQDGMYQWTDTDPNNPTGLTKNYNEADRINTHKSSIAPYTGGFGLTGVWKGLSLTADFSWVAGNWGFNNWIFFVANPEFGSAGYNLSTEAMDYWKKPGDDARYARLDAVKRGGTTSATGMQSYDTQSLESGSFLRLKNIQLSYTLPNHILARTKFIKGLKVWVGARNLWTLTGYRGLDPEAVESRVDVDAYPNTRQFTFGLEFKF